MTPDVEALVGAFLRANSQIQVLVGSRVVGRTPTTTTDPWIRITQIDDTTRSPVHLVTVFLQLDCYGGDDPDSAQREASVLARTVRQVLEALPGPVDDGAVVAAVTFSGLRRVPDTEFKPARERYILDADVTVHP